MNVLTPQKLAELIDFSSGVVNQPYMSDAIYSAFKHWLKRTGDGLHGGNCYKEGDKRMPDPRFWKRVHDDEKGGIDYGSGSCVGMQMFLDARYDKNDWNDAMN